MVSRRRFFAVSRNFPVLDSLPMLRGFVCAISLFAGMSTAWAAPPSNLIVFGDSLSDTGNVYNNTTTILGRIFYPGSGALGGNYTNGRFTDGTDTTPATQLTGVWHEQLAPMIRVGLATASTNNPAGMNYAWGGTVTTNTQTTISESGASVTVHDLGVQVTDFANTLQNGAKADANALYSVWAGGNDLINAGDGAVANAKAGGTLNNASANDVLAAETAAVANDKAAINSLYQLGARNFIWPDMPPMNLIPKIQGYLDPTIKDPKIIGALQGIIGAEGTAAANFKTDELTAIAALKLADPGITIVPVDVFGLFTNVLANPGNFGFTNSTSPAQGVAMANPDQYVFWDTIHPTTKADQLIANAAYNALLPVGLAPEPSSWVLLSMAAPILYLWRRRLRR